MLGHEREHQAHPTLLDHLGTARLRTLEIAGGMLSRVDQRDAIENDYSTRAERSAWWLSRRMMSLEIAGGMSSLVAVKMNDVAGDCGRNEQSGSGQDE